MSIPAQARRVAKLLRDKDLKVVFAESCTGGLVSGALTAIPGISAHHCGGMIVYRNETKVEYLDISADLLATAGPVSAEVTHDLAAAILARTPEADFALAITGHLGPGAPAELDGRIFIAVVGRLPPVSPGKKNQIVKVDIAHFQFQAGTSRSVRQRRAVELALVELAKALEAE